MDNPREIQALESRIVFLESLRRDVGTITTQSEQKKLDAIAAYDNRFRSLLKQYPEVKEAFDSFACLYQLAVNRSILDDAQAMGRDGCYLCWTEDEIIKHETADRARRRGDA